MFKNELLCNVCMNDESPIIINSIKRRMAVSSGVFFFAPRWYNGIVPKQNIEFCLLYTQFPKALDINGEMNNVTRVPRLVTGRIRRPTVSGELV